MADVVAMDNNIRKEHRRMRDIGNESPAVLAAMAATRALEQEEDRKRQLAVWQTNQNARAAKKAKTDVAEAHAALKKKQTRFKG